MPKFRKRPVTIEAMYYDGSYQSGKEILNWADDSVYRNDLVTLKIKTLEGEMTLYPGSWLIKGVMDEFYPCDPEVFERTYEPVEEEG